MPGDPRECRRHAVRCAELAINVKDAEFKAIYLALSKQWEMFALELEGAEAMLSGISQNTENSHKSP